MLLSLKCRFVFAVSGGNIDRPLEIPTPVATSDQGINIDTVSSFKEMKALPAITFIIAITIMLFTFKMK